MINIYKPYKIENSPSILDALKDGYISSQGKYIPKVEEKINGTWEDIDPQQYMTSQFDATGNKIFSGDCNNKIIK